MAGDYGPLLLEMVVGIGEQLALYRVHGANDWSTRFLDDREGPRRRAENYAREFHLVRRALQERLGVESEMSLEDHYYYQYCRRRAGERVSALQLVKPVLGSSLLPAGEKL